MGLGCIAALLGCIAACGAEYVTVGTRARLVLAPACHLLHRTGRCHSAGLCELPEHCLEAQYRGRALCGSHVLRIVLRRGAGGAILRSPAVGLHPGQLQDLGGTGKGQVVGSGLQGDCRGYAVCPPVWPCITPPGQWDASQGPARAGGESMVRIRMRIMAKSMCRRAWG